MPQSNAPSAAAPLGATSRGRMLVFGLGYTGYTISRAAAAAGFAVQVTSRGAESVEQRDGFAVVPFGAAGPAILAATHVISTVPPGREEGDPVLLAWASAIGAAPALRWLGYLSTTGVYGDRGGAAVDERTEPRPQQDRSRRRLRAEEEWAALLRPGLSLDLFRVGGIYGPGRSPFDDLRAGQARRVARPGHVFSRIHRDDIARAVVAAADKPAEGRRVLHLVDDEPVETAAMVAEAARLLGLPVPPAIPFEEAVATMSPMARSFWSENRRVENRLTKVALGLEWRYPTYREGLRGILAQERVEGAGEQNEV
ncbi:SDR family oxidoreductase [Roseomonas elaeocarpi]|uniref:SDR family oxidoreductase n=1 Tax=Roseomonas elaeocarpi TaxID=907779 RepID=A0ABV6JVU6_9PROT